MKTARIVFCFPNESKWQPTSTYPVVWKMGKYQVFDSCQWVRSRQDLRAVGIQCRKGTEHFFPPYAPTLTQNPVPLQALHVLDRDSSSSTFQNMGKRKKEGECYQFSILMIFGEMKLVFFLFRFELKYQFYNFHVSPQPVFPYKKSIFKRAEREKTLHSQTSVHFFQLSCELERRDFFSFIHGNSILLSSTTNFPFEKIEIRR